LIEALPCVVDLDAIERGEQFVVDVTPLAFGLHGPQRRGRTG
jgi:hypothetical protein